MESAAFLASNKKPTEARDQAGAGQQPLPLRHPCPHRARRQARRRHSVREASHDQAFRSVPPRHAQGRRRARRQLLARRPRSTTALAQGARRGQAARAHRGRRLPRHRRRGQCARSIPARSISAPASTPRSRRSPPKSSTCRSTASRDRHRRHRAHARPGHDLGQPHDPGSAACRSATRRRPRARRCSTRRRKRLGVKPEELTRRRRRHQRPAASSVSYGELIGGKAFALKLDHAKPAKAKDPKDYKIVGKSVPRVDIPDKVTGTLHLHAGLPRAAACCTAAWCARRRSAPSSKASTKARSRTSPASSGSCARATSSASWRETEWAAIKAARAAQGHLVEMGRPARAGQALGARARHQGRQGRGDQQRRQRRRGDGARTAPRSSTPPTTSPSTRTARSGRPARSPSSRTAS